MGFNKVMHNISIAEDAGHPVSLKLKDGRFFPVCRVDRIAEKTITIIHRIKGQKPKRTAIKITDLIEVTMIKESDAA